MPEPLTLARFKELADAYGSVIARWPEQHREASLAMASQPAAREILSGASFLDETLDMWQVAAPTASLRDRVIRSTPAPAGKIVARARLWWSGVGIAAALAGATAGTAAVAIAAPNDISSDSATSFGDVFGSET